MKVPSLSTIAGRSQRLRRHVAALLGFCALSVAMTWPLPAHLSTHVVGAKWFYDSMVNIQVLGSRVHYALGMSSSLKSVYDDYFCAPTPFSIANNEDHFALALLYAPFYLPSGDPLLAYNLLLLLCISLSGFCMYLLVRELSGSALAGVLSGVGYAFCPYIAFELGRLQLVAAQWVPLFALFLHRSAKSGRLLDLLGLGLAFALQVGSCLYYAVFLALYGTFAGTWLVLRHRPRPRATLLNLSVAAALTALPVAGMLYPYFRARQDFPLTRSENLATKYAGRIEDFTKVYSYNKLLAPLRDDARGPTEPIAFPGFTLLLLASLALVMPVVGALKRGPRAARVAHLQTLALSAVGVLLAAGLSLWLSDLVPALAVGLAALVLWRLRKRERLLPPDTLLYLGMAVLGVLLFLGPTPFAVHGEPMTGPYEYLYRHVPGLDGMRYVSRFQILIMLALAVLAGFGAARLLGGAGRLRLLWFPVLLAAMLLELRNAPIPLNRLPSRAKLPPVYAWLQAHRGPEPIANIPSYTLGYYGARNDYLSLFHRRRTIDGKSSWMPPVTYAYIYESRRFPRSTLTNLLQALGAKFLVVHTREYRSAGRAARIRSWLDKRPEDYRARFGADGDYVYEILPPRDSSMSLLSTPRVPPQARPLARSELRGRASVQSAFAGLALDGNPRSSWGTGRAQLAGDWFEIDFGKEHTVAALELRHFSNAFDAPAAFTLSVQREDGGYDPVFTRPTLRFYSDQVYHPNSFTFRVVLARPARTRAIRIDLLDGVAGHAWSIHEATVWALD